MLLAVRRLPATMPESDRLSKGRYDTHQDHWDGWLSEYNGPGFYGRSSWNVDAGTVYQRLNNGHIIVWLNEAAGENPHLIRITVNEILAHRERQIALYGKRGHPQARAHIARTHHPWERAASLLFK